jgi:signal transduction histidine kinase
MELENEASVRMAAEARVKLLLERLVTAQEEERRRLARNLHDHMGQQLTALNLTLDSVAEDMNMPPALRARLSTAQDIVKRLDKDVDLLAWDLRPAALDLGLPAALSDLVRQWSAATQVTGEFHQSELHDVRLPAHAEANVYRIVQEALTNVAKHAGASHVSVLLEQRRDDLAVIVEDDGRGFDPDKAIASHGLHSGMGLLSMQERAAQFDGTIELESSPGQGTTVFVRVPLAAVPDDTATANLT